MEEEAALKMTALKAAYAEVILNASKEAAARIMAADRKALRVEHELFAFKEDSLRMLLRLKQMLDSKTAEAELRSQRQQEKIEELEAQLSEAEGIIIDLREELRQVQDESEKTKYNQINLLTEHSMQQEEATNNTSEDNEDRPPSLNSRIIAGVDNERYRTTYFSVSEDPTQVAKMAVSQNLVVGSDRGELASSDQNNCKEPCTSSSADLDEKDGKISQEPQTEMIDDSKYSSQSGRASCRRPRKNVKYQEAIAALRPRAKSSYLPSIYRCSTSLAGNDAKLVATVFHSRSKPDDSTIRDDKIIDHDPLYDTALNKVVLKKDDNVVDGKAGASNSRRDVDPLLVDSKLHGLDESEEAKEGTPHQADENKCVTTNLQRKRKKEALAVLDDNIVPEMNGVKRRVVGDEEDISSMNKSVLRDEPPKDSKQLLQIAHQLASLAGDWR